MVEKDQRVYAAALARITRVLAFRLRDEKLAVSRQRTKLAIDFASTCHPFIDDQDNFPPGERDVLRETMLEAESNQPKTSCTVSAKRLV